MFDERIVQLDTLGGCERDRTMLDWDYMLSAGMNTGINKGSFHFHINQLNFFVFYSEFSLPKITLKIFK